MPAGTSAAVVGAMAASNAAAAAMIASRTAQGVGGGEVLLPLVLTEFEGLVVRIVIVLTFMSIGYGVWKGKDWEEKTLFGMIGLLAPSAGVLLVLLLVSMGVFLFS